MNLAGLDHLVGGGRGASPVAMTEDARLGIGNLENFTRSSYQLVISKTKVERRNKVV